MLERSRLLVASVRRMERERICERLEEMAKDFPHSVRLVLRLAADRLRAEGDGNG